LSARSLMITPSSEKTPGVFDTAVFRRNFLDEVRMSKGLARRRDLRHQLLAMPLLVMV